MRLIFMGTPDFSVPALKALINSDHEVVAVYSQPPRRAGRGKKVQLSPVHQTAEDAGIPVFTPLNFKDQAVRDVFANHLADLAVVAAYGLILPQVVLDAPKRGCLNIHASLLPRWRGAAPIHRAIEAGDKETGVGLMQMELGLDTGPVHAEARVDLSSTTTTGALHDELAELGARLLTTHLDTILSGKSIPTPQREEGITYAHKIDKAEAVINWSRPVAEIDRHIRAMTPFPGAFTHLGENRLRVLKGTPVLSAPEGHMPGSLVNDSGLIACGDGAYQLETVQRAGKAAADIDAFLRGYSLAQGTQLTDEPS